MTKNLNQLTINEDGDGRFYEQVHLRDFGVSSSDGVTRALFKDLESRLIAKIQQYDCVVGCVAWLTSEPILEALAKTKGVAIVVQKEDFLRPDYGQHNGWNRKLRQLYAALPSTLNRINPGFADSVLYCMSCCGDPTINAVRCVGNHNANKESAFPRSHHKFVVFCDLIDTDIESAGGAPNIWPVITPREVWTGSFNFTKNASMSFENAITSTEKAIVQAYFMEAAQILALSEPLDWETPWSEPEWRIGT